MSRRTTTLEAARSMSSAQRAGNARDATRQNRLVRLPVRAWAKVRPETSHDSRIGPRGALLATSDGVSVGGADPGGDRLQAQDRPAARAERDQRADPRRRNGAPRPSGPLARGAVRFARDDQPRP